LMEGALVFPRSRYLSWGYFAEYFGPSFVTDRSICAFAIEPNPIHARRLRHLTMRLRADGRRAEVLHAAASNQSGTLSFYQRTDERTESDSGVGFGAKHEEANGKNRTLRYETVRIPMMDLGLFILQELVNRTIPSDGVQSNVAPGDVRPPAILMKLDVEGAELVVLERMRTLGVLCDVNFISFEYHPKRLYPEDGVKDPNSYAAHRDLFDLMAAGMQQKEDRGIGIWQKHLRKWVFPATRFHWEERIRAVMHERHVVAPRSVPVQADVRHQRCSTRFAARDDESYPKLPDVPGAEWEPQQVI